MTEKLMIKKAKFKFSYQNWGNSHSECIKNKCYNIMIEPFRSGDIMVTINFNNGILYTYRSLEHFLLDWEW